MTLTEGQLEAGERAAAFAGRVLAPHVSSWDRDETLPHSVVDALAAEGLLGAVVPRAWGGAQVDHLALGLVVEALGHVSPSVASLLTVHGMVAAALERWGTDAQRARWLPELAQGKALAAFALSEPEVGSDAKSVGTTARLEGEAFVLDGRKKWITGAQLAQLFLVVARVEEDVGAFLVPRDTPGLRVEPMSGLLGFRSARLGECVLEGCRVPSDALVGPRGFGFSPVVGTALDLGRYTVAWSCVGLGRACLVASVRYAGERTQFGKPLREHQLVQRLLADMATRLEASRLLCLRAGELREQKDPRGLMQAVMAKYFAAQMATAAAADAVQLHGANGLGNGHPVQRYLRDARVMEVIEGTTQVLETVIARHGLGPDGELR